jgi:tetratricopeptide (TPR) repeat protein
MKKMIALFTLLPLILFISNAGFTQTKQEEIIEKYLKSCAYQYNYTMYMSDWQACIDKGLAEDSTIAYLWQQKSMPCFKARKYEIGLSYLDKAVQYDKKKWLPYRAFIKCIFIKSYADAIVDIDTYIAKYGDSYTMDHPLIFYKGLCLLQLNRYPAAAACFDTYLNQMKQERVEKDIHYLAYFYKGIAMMEQGLYAAANDYFDKSLSRYPNFSDAKYYKVACLNKLPNTDTAALTKLMESAKSDAAQGYTINEDNVYYERYPYQVRWPK